MCSTNNSTAKIMVFRPTWKEFTNFNSYIQVMESQGAHKGGVAKVIPPPEWEPRKKSYDQDDIMSMIIPAPIRQTVNGKQGIYEQDNIKEKPMTVADFKKMAESDKYKTPTHFDYKDLERKFWKTVMYNPPLYGADVSGTMTDKDVDVWNINKLGTILDYINEDYGMSFEGVNTAYLYFGMWKTSFAWHTEDMDLYSINYIHDGYPKSWYAIPPEHGRRFERVVNDIYPAYASACSAFLRHKITIISPLKLKQYSIPYNKITQSQGEIIVTFPYGYHSGFNHGFNIAESTNFASPRWVEYGKRASKCHCPQNSINFSMDTFVKRLQPEKYELWLQGEDIGTHPEDPSRILDAPMPTKSDILCNMNNNGIPKCYKEARRKRCPKNLKPSDSQFSNDTKHNNKALDVKSSKNVQGLDEKKEDEQREEKTIVKKRMINEQETKSKKKNSKSTDRKFVAPDETINHMVSTTISSKGSDSIIKKVINKSPLNGANNERLLSKKCDSVNDKAHSNLLITKPLSPIKFDKPHSSSLTSSNTNINTENQSYITQNLKIQDNMEFTQHFFQPTPEPIKNKNGEEYRIDGIRKIITDIVNSCWSLDTEQLYNTFRSMNYPYCSLCMMFNCEKLTFNLDWQTNARSSMLLNSANSLKPSKALFIHAISGTGKVFKADLVRCENCYLIVHKVCYGINVDTSSHWLCDRCMKSFMNASLCNIICIHCPLKYGAIKEFKKNEWSHVECHLIVHGSNPLTMNTFSADFLNNKKCVICKLSCGYCCRCSDASCNAWSHISCGIFAGFEYRIDQINKHILIDCIDHCYVSDEQQVVHMNQKVWVRHSDNRIMECKIINVDETPLCLVQFSDGSMSDSIPLKEIKDFANDLPLTINQEIHLQSGEKGLFLGLNYNKDTYSVSYDNGRTGVVHTNDILFWEDKQMSYLKQLTKRGLAKYQKIEGLKMMWTK